MATFPRQTDIEVLGQHFDDDLKRSQFDLVPDVARHDGALYGGTAIAASVVAMEAATQWGALWVTTQYVATAQQGDTVVCRAEVLARGRNVAQLQVTGQCGDRILFVSLGSTATPREGGLEGQFRVMPEVTAPEETRPMEFGPFHSTGFRGFMAQVEYRQATLGGPEPTAQLALWARLHRDRPMTAASIAFVADMVPGAIARAAGLIGGGTSLDNSLRFGHVEDGTEWVLLELHAELAVGAHAHGSVRVWSRDGRLLAVGGQSANMSHMVTPDEFEKLVASTEEIRTN
jgi:acyl-CoA thioesterase-2